MGNPGTGVSHRLRGGILCPMAGRPGEPMARDTQTAWQDAWVHQFRSLGERQGFHEPLGPGHVASFQDKGDTLLVSFDALPRLRRLTRGRPLGLEMSRAFGWSALNVVGLQDGWFRDAAIGRFFDQLQADGFLSAFDTVLFCGTGGGGYAACTYARALPGARVLAFAPQATLDPDLAGWDPRFRKARRQAFGGTYGHAPDGLAETDAAFVVYDPHQTWDAAHAALLAGGGAQLLKTPHLGSDPAEHLRAVGLLPRLLSALAQGTLDRVSFARMFRARRRYQPYLLELLDTLGAHDRTALANRLCRAVARRGDVPDIEAWLHRSGAV